METKLFAVEVVSRQRLIYRIEAPDAGAAKRIGMDRWQHNAASDVDGFEWQEVESINVAPVADPGRESQDEELTLRFIRERERILLRLGSTFFGASLNDAISGAQAALDLGWYRPDERGSVVDVFRAARALERLCAKQLLVSFSKQRARAGERGEILLYCTPEYLERLGDSLEQRVIRSAS
jgi:hypothetical protein